MANKGKFIIGVALIIGALIIALFFGQSKPKPSIVKVLYGSEKKGLLADEKIKKILLEKYNVVVEGTKMGSLEMADAGIQGVDGIWPSSQLAALVFKNRRPGTARKSANIFNTPIVFYSWPEVVDVLIKLNIVEKRDGAYYVIDTRKYMEMVVQRVPWKSVGLERQVGWMSLVCTDPVKSNSGFLVAGLMAVILNSGNMVDETALQSYLPVIVDIFKRMGFMENSTGILFDKYIKQGQGAFPVIAAYENLIIEFFKAFPDYQDLIRKRTRVMIPEPTVWSEHPFIALTEKGETVLNALQDSEIQKLAWEDYGFRSGVLGIENDPGVLKEIGLPQRIDSVTPLPSPDVMNEIVTALQ